MDFIMADLNANMDARMPLSPTSRFVTDAGAPVPADSGSISQQLTDPTVLGSTATYNDTINSHISEISTYLLQTDLFAGNMHGKPAPGMSTFNGSTIYKGTNNSASKFLQLAKGVNKSLAASSVTNDLGVRIVASDGRPAAIVASMQSSAEQSTPDIAPQEMQLAEAMLAGNINPGRLITLALKYGFIYKAQYLGSYDVNGSGDTLIKKPLWLNLTTGVVQSAETAGKRLLCRIQKHANLLKSFEGLKAPIYNEYFIIGPAGAGNDMFVQPPVSSPIVPTAAPPLGLLTSMFEYADSIDFANSFDEDVAHGSAPDPLQDYVLHGTPLVALIHVDLSTPTQVGTPTATGYLGMTGVTGGGTPTPTGYQGVTGIPGQAPPEPTPMTPGQRRSSFSRFIEWYEKPIGTPSLPRYARGDGVWRPWPLPVPASSAWLRGARTAQLLQNGSGPIARRRDILVSYRQFAEQHGRPPLPPIPR